MLSIEFSLFAILIDSNFPFFEILFTFVANNIIMAAIGDVFEALFPIFKAVGGYLNVLWGLLIAVGCFGWVTYMSKNPDPIERFD